jgi:cell division protein FtsX
MMIIFIALLMFWLIVLTLHIRNYYKHNNELPKSLEANTELQNELDKINIEYNNVLDKYIETSDELEKIKKIYYNLYDLNYQSLNANKHTLQRLVQIDTNKYSNKDEIQNKLDLSFNKLNEVFAK